MHCLTFDIEEHFQVSRFDSPIRRRHWGSFQSRVTLNTCKLLDLLARYQTRATFFVLAWVAERHPGLIKQIIECGHEIASHGYGHELVTAQTPELFRADVRKAKQILEDLTGRPSRVIGRLASPLPGKPSGLYRFWQKKAIRTTRASSPSDMTIAVFLDRTLGTICDKPLQAPFGKYPPPR